MASDIARYLVAGGFGSITPPNVTIFSNQYPAHPDNLIAVWARPGEGPVDAFGLTDHGVFGLQILVRNISVNPCITTAKNVHLYLHKFKGMLDGTEYKCVWSKDIPFPLGQDENNRYQWSNNYFVRRPV